MIDKSRPISAKVAQGDVTRAQILRTAERLFAESGYDGVPLRRIAAEAGLKLPLIVYHFGSKEGLYRALFEKNVQHIIAARNEAIADLLDRSTTMSVREILAEFSRPWIEFFSDKNNDGARVFARSFFEHSQLQMELVEHPLDKQAKIFITALKAAAPFAPEDEVQRCYHLFVANQLFFILERDRIKRISGRKVSEFREALAFVSDLIAQRLESYEQ